VGRVRVRVRGRGRVRVRVRGSGRGGGRVLPLACAFHGCDGRAEDELVGLDVRRLLDRAQHTHHTHPVAAAAEGRDEARVAHHVRPEPGGADLRHEIHGEVALHAG